MRIDLTRRAPPIPEVAVNGVVIDRADIAREVQNHPGESAKAAWGDATRALVVRELLLQRARALGCVAAPRTHDGARETDEDALVRALLEQEVRTPEADESACCRYYQSNLARFRSPDLFEPLHILFRAARADEAAYAKATASAEAVLAELAARPERFEALARGLSDCPSAREGGRLGQVSQAEVTPEFASALQSMREGETRIAPARYGVHVVRLERRVDGAILPFDHVRDRVAAYLEEATWHRGVAQYVGLLAGQARITGFTMPGATSPLVQ